MCTERKGRQGLAGTATAEPQTRPVRRKVRKKRQPQGVRAIVARIRPAEAEALLLLALFGFALIMRWPNLMRLPHFTDEIGEIRYLLQIYRGENFPLTAQVTYFGPVHHYLVAICFWLFGPSIALPRTIVCVIGALTVAMTYLIGRELGGWRLGLLGGALLATLPQHIVVNSHVAWANSTTPIYATVCFYAILRAGRALPAPAGAAPPARHFRAAGGWLLLCGLVFGLMLQTHVGTIVLAPAIGGTLLVALWRTRGWRLLGIPWPYLAPLLTVLAYSPVIIENARSGFAGYYRARGRDYAFVADPSTDTYVSNLRNLLYEVARMISNPFRTPARLLDYFTSPYMLIAVALALLGLTLLARRGQILPALATLITALTMPYFNHAYGVDGDRYLVTGRYIAFLLPLLTIAIGAGALALATLALRAIPRRPARGVPLRTVAAVGSVALMLALILYPIIPLRRYYTHESGLDPDNASFLDTVAFVNSVRGTRAPVLIGPLFVKVDLKDGADALDILDILLTLDGVPHRVLKDPRTELPQIAAGIDPRDTAAQPIVIMMRDECFPIREEVPLLRLSGRYRLRELYWASPSYYGVYRYTPGLAPGASCLPASGPTPGD